MSQTARIFLKSGKSPPRPASWRSSFAVRAELRLCMPGTRPAAEVRKRRRTTAKLTSATIPAKARNSKWSPTPTAGHENPQGSAVRSRAVCVPVPRKCGRLDALQAEIGRQRALLLQGFFADGVVFPPLNPDGLRHRS